MTKTKPAASISRMPRKWLVAGARLAAVVVVAAMEDPSESAATMMAEGAADDMRDVGIAAIPGLQCLSDPGLEDRDRFFMELLPQRWTRKARSIICDFRLAATD